MNLTLKLASLLLLMSAQGKVQIYVTDGPIERVGQRMYKKELLVNAQGPKELAYDSSSRNLFFMYMDDELQNSGRAFVNILTKKSQKIKGIEKNKATAVDYETGDVYFGSENGLYRYNPLTKKAENIGMYNMNIMKIVIRNDAMFVLYADDHMIYKVYNEGAMVVKAGAMTSVIEFNVDNQKNIHYQSLCGVYCMLDGHEIIKNRDLDTVYHFLVDDARTLAVTEGGLYTIDCANGTAKKISDLDFLPSSIIYGDYGDIFYSIDNYIYRLRPIKSYLVYNIHRLISNDVSTQV